jgi:ubiquinone/menaquinone biosynthesis C-methylase UbiE
MSRDPLTGITSVTARPLRRNQERLAKVYDDEVYPLYAQRFADMLLRALGPRAGAAVLEVGCGAGALTTELLRKLDRESRILAVDGSAALIERARARVATEHPGRRVFFRQHDPEVKLPFDDETQDLVVANLVLGDVAQPAAVLADLARVARPGGQVVVTVPLRGTWAEPLDLFREVLVRLGRKDGLQALDAYLAAQPEGESMARALEAAGLERVEEELARWELLFRSGREFFYAPVIEHGPLSRWKDIAGRGEAMQDVFLALKDAIDIYFAGHTFAASIFGGCFSGWKPAAPEATQP